MAVIRRERKTAGKRKAYSYQVRWRYCGRGEWQSRTVDNRGDANALNDAIRDLGWALLDTDERVTTLSLIGARVGQSEKDRLEARNASLTVYEAVREWVTRPDLSEGSKSAYNATLVRLGWLGERRIGTVTDREIKQWLAQQAEGLSDNSMLSSWVVLSGTLHAHGRDRLKGKNGKKPYLGEREIEPVLLNAEQRKLVIAAAEPIHLGLMAKIALGTGLRAGELCGLQVKHLHRLDSPEEARIRVQQQLPQKTTRKGGFKVSPTKGRRSRNVPIPTTLRLELLERFGDANPEAVVLRPPYAPYWTHSPMEKNWRRAMTEAEGVPSETRIHDLRHTYGKMLLQQGYQLSWVSRLLGHSSPKVTAMVYGGYDDDSMEMARQLLDLALGDV